MKYSLWQVVKLYFQWKRYVKNAWASHQTALGFVLWLDNRETNAGLDHIENLLDCINDARESTIPAISDNESLATISFGYAEKIRSANDFLRRSRWYG